MDFWTRLLGGARSTSRQPTPNNPQQRLARFKKVYEQIRITYQKTPLLQADSAAAEAIRAHFQRLTTILHDESRSPAPHPCLSYAASAQIYILVSRIGSVAQHEGVIHEAVAVFGALIDSEEEEFLAHERFAHALMTFVDRTSGSANLNVGEDTEGEIVELLFGIAAKIRLQPELLKVWFNKRADTAQARSESNARKDFVGVTSKEDFPLCYQLIDHVHHDGRIGDFARTGLLYIFESASKAPDLEQWLVNSDLPTLMASGLGALYSQLSRKLSIIHSPTDLPLVLTLSDYKELQAPTEAENLFSPHLQGHMETFLSYLAFWQDVLEHCRSLEVRQTLLDHFQVLFLQQLLYPSMLESSDIDGGSSVAVLTYLRRILEALDHAELVHLILHYLLALPDPPESDPRLSKSVQVTKRRMTLIMSTKPDNDEDQPNPALFNLVDLLVSSMESDNPQTVIVALKLSTALMGKNHPYAIDTLLQTIPTTHREPLRTHGALNAELEHYIALAEDIAGDSGLDEAYDNHLHDALRLVEFHTCSIKLLSLEGLGVNPPASLLINRQMTSHPVTSHHLHPTDPFITRLFNTLKTFLTNNIELNLSLTQCLTTLLACPHLHLDPWACVDPAHYILPTSPDEPTSDPALQSLLRARQHPTWAPEHTPIILSHFQSLASEIHTLRAQIPTMDALIAARKQAFRLHDDIATAMRDAARQQSRPGLSGRPSTEAQRPGSTRAPSAVRGAKPAIPHRMYVGSGASSRSQSPRGRLGPELRAPPRSEPDASRGRAVSGEGRGGLLADVVSQAEGVEGMRRIKFPLRKEKEERKEAGVVEERVEEGEVAEGGEGEGLKAEVKAEEVAQDGDEVVEREASLGHILTNIVILQEFILEIAAIMQLRASLLSEVKFAI
ncbi:hypothetical protein EJ06DRAFT_529910 [Trichodelitschia bisporula]|uniref:FHF complex subunit HOOK-interacting protein C-terminal domain-containing protein n=1 Tax=Trichodelitschia bisporula TaxID=703511 RepID=A0A6G1HY29_9PEZI|nr:hypothetical protein EJ06DRAFT_529910 [Trichodelitschia bisporula]